MTFTKFEEINVWQKSIDFAALIYSEFNKIKDYSFKDQINRASVSISNNIAEGFDRGSKLEFVRFLKISRGSCSEVKSMLYLAKKLSYINEQNFDFLINYSTDIHKMLNALIKYLQNDNKH